MKDCDHPNLKTAYCPGCGRPRAKLSSNGSAMELALHLSKRIRTLHNEQTRVNIALGKSTHHSRQLLLREASVKKRLEQWQRYRTALHRLMELERRK